MFGLTTNTHLKAQVDKATKDYIELQGEIATKKAELKGKELALENDKQKLQMAMDIKAHEANLKVSTANSEFDSAKKLWEGEREALISNLEKKSELDKFELETTLKLKAEQDVAQAKLNADKKVAELSAKHVEEVSKLKTEHAEKLAEVAKKANDDAYKSIKSNLEDVTKHGTAASKDTKELIGALIAQMPRGGADINANLNMSNTPQITNAKDVTTPS